MWPFNQQHNDPILNDASVRAEVERAMAEMQAKTAGLDAIIHFEEAAWAVSLEEGTISFLPTDSIGKDEPGMMAVAPVQIIGTYNQDDGTFLWAWDHPSIEDQLAEHARKVRAYGEEHQLTPLTDRKIVCSEEDCWEFTALACQLNAAQGAYRGPEGTTLIYMTFGNVQLKPEFSF